MESGENSHRIWELLEKMRKVRNETTGSFEKGAPMLREHSKIEEGTSSTINEIICSLKNHSEFSGTAVFTIPPMENFGVLPIKSIQQTAQ